MENVVTRASRDPPALLDHLELVDQRLLSAVKVYVDLRETLDLLVQKVKVETKEIREI